MQLAVNSASIGVDLNSYCKCPHVLRTEGPRYNEWSPAGKIKPAAVGIRAALATVTRLRQAASRPMSGRLERV